MLQQLLIEVPVSLLRCLGALLKKYIFVFDFFLISDILFTVNSPPPMSEFVRISQTSPSPCARISFVNVPLRDWRQLSWQIVNSQRDCKPAKIYPITCRTLWFTLIFLFNSMLLAFMGIYVTCGRGGGRISKLRVSLYSAVFLSPRPPKEHGRFSIC